ncbi:NADH-quinone oxidoreductase subunit C [Flammeovirga yaeyamensis]|uniref:NADH-quinone oxidoreductase subunit C n=1 Tax=Flammeovirga yaeyamensis TaxID=367791 RepID=A0AAX1N2X7_9BACT|nr:NADH-quinone oxidoreductase subunit C [Flammeovirga yaeyamensis]MBB3701067.1 NADH-quinone oxidoreductase subunit C [Flammeovirga yaeyamensis]NMF38102.1 NADH-quinone oxidoreductase subunit C [Flammeovirga yaeyamensis]QWG01874.1 NADH-quinone oxidoreductase subunit C [Flammeovirga yaeyamensis]
MTTEEIAQLIQEHVNVEVEVNTKQPQHEIIVKNVDIEKVCRFLKSDNRLMFDNLSCLTGIDNGPKANTMEVVYNLYSITKSFRLTLKVMLDRETPLLPSVTSVWKAANWHEREAYDLVGMTFENHQDLRRILSPDDWEGHPLQKDYKEQEKYHGITVKYERD